jgi:PhnB protein
VGGATLGGMDETPLALPAAQITGRGTTLNPFVVVDDAAGLIDFVTEVFGGREVAEARTPTPDGRLIHAEVRLGDALLLVADALEGWPVHPALLQLWVADVGEVLARAEARGGRIVTPPTPFYGSVTLARLEDPWGDLWWLYQPVPGQADPVPAWEGGSDTVFRTIDEYFRAVG